MEMEGVVDKINDKIKDYMNETKGKLISMVMDAKTPADMEGIKKEILNCEILKINRDMVEKRKRVRKSVEESDRCTGELGNGERCTRRKKPGSMFCGTHGKQKVVEKKRKLKIEEIDGIAYYTCDDVVYKPEDVLSGKEPAVIGKIVDGKFEAILT